MMENDDVFGKKIDKAGFQDKVKMSDVWILLIKRAMLARLEDKTNDYYRCIDSILVILFKESRYKMIGIFNYLKKHPELYTNKIEMYDKELSYIVDELKDLGYLSKQSQQAIYGSGNEEETKGEDEL